MEPIKQLKDLNLLDRFLFAEAMDDQTFMENALSIILDEDVKLKTLPQTEKEFRNAALLKQVRLDVVGLGETDTIYHTEAQKQNTYNLPKRSRYYQAFIDSNLLTVGEINYGRLQELYQIMIMPFDLFKQGLYQYSFRMTCKEVPGLELGDGVTRIFLNTRGRKPEGVRQELIDLLHYFEQTTTENARQSGNRRLMEMDESVSRIRENEEVGVRFMQAWEEKILDKEEGRTEGMRIGEERGLKLGEERGLQKGRLEGEQKGKLATAAKMLAKGYPLEEIAELTGLSEREVAELHKLTDQSKANG